MEFTNQLALYKKLLPVFNVKLRLLNNKDNITKEDIWKYLAITKWKSSINLNFCEIVNDIISVNIEDIDNFKRGRN